MNAGYDDEDYGNEFVDLEGIQDELGAFGDKPLPLNASKIIDKYQNFEKDEDEIDFVEDPVDEKNEEGMPMDQFLAQMRQNTLDDLDLAGSDDEAYSDNGEFIDSPIKDDYFEGKVEDDPTPVLDEEDEPDFTKMNNPFGSK